MPLQDEIKVQPDHFDHPRKIDNSPTDFADFSYFLTRHRIGHDLCAYPNDMGDDLGVIRIHAGKPGVIGRADDTAVHFHFDVNGDFVVLDWD